MSDLRTTLHSVYAFIRSVEVNKAVASLTLDHLIQEQISRYKSNTNRTILDSKGASLGNRISYLDTLDSLEKDINTLVTTLNDKGADQAKLEALGLNQEAPNSGGTTST